jgi:predicted phage-related endonuclease
MKHSPALKSYIDRRAFIGGSDARIIMGGDDAALIRLWREKRGEIEPEDLSGSLIVQLGTATETLNRHWYERNSGRKVVEVQRRVQHSAISWMAATLDGMVEGSCAVFEAKFMLPWSFDEQAAAEKHMAQVQHNMWVTHARSAVLPLSRVAASGSRFPFQWIHSILAFWSQLRRSSGDVCSRVSRRIRLIPSHHGPGSKPSVSST